MDEDSDHRDDEPEHTEQTGNPAREIADPGSAAEIEVTKSLKGVTDTVGGASSSSTAPVALSTKIEELKAKQTAMLAERKRLTKDLRNAEKRRKRLKSNARRLSDEDLAEVLRMREHVRKTEEKEEKTAVPKATAASKSASKPKSMAR